MRFEIAEDKQNIEYGTLLISKYGDKFLVVNSHEYDKFSVVNLKTFSYGVYSNFQDFAFEEGIISTIPHDRICLKVSD